MVNFLICSNCGRPIGHTIEILKSCECNASARKSQEKQKLENKQLEQDEGSNSPHITLTIERNKRKKDWYYFVK